MHDHVLHDAKYRVMLDLVNDWVKQIESSKVFERFTDASRIGEGGFGVVFKAFDTKRLDWVAVKVPHFPKMPIDRHTITLSTELI